MTAVQPRCREFCICIAMSAQHISICMVLLVSQRLHRASQC